MFILAALHIDGLRVPLDRSGVNIWAFHLLRTVGIPRLHTVDTNVELPRDNSRRQRLSRH
jgi:hypothetical protein